MKFFLTSLLIFSTIYSLQAGECQVHNRPDFLALNSDNSRLSVSNFANSLTTLLGLSAEQTEEYEHPFFYSTRSLQIPSSTWLFHVEGLGRLSERGISLEDNGDFDIDSIQSKLTKAGNSDALNTGSILISSEADMNNLGQTLSNLVSQMDKKAPVKYVVIVCDECNNEKSLQELQNQLKKTVDPIIAKDPQTLAMTLTTKESARVRRARQADDEIASNVTIATMYSDEYPTMFHLFFWTSLVFAIIVISIVYVFLTLDPGSDTVIYRLTNPRLKVD